MAEVTDETLSKLVAVLNKLEGKTGTGQSIPEEQLEAREKMAKMRSEALKNARQLQDVEDATVKSLQDQIKAQNDQLDLLVKKNELTEEEAKQIAENITQLEQQLEIQKTINADSDQILSTYFGINNQTKQFAKAMKQAGGGVQYAKKVAGGLKQNLTAANISAALLKKSFENIKKLGKSIGGEILKPVSASTDLVSTLEKATKRQDEFRLAAREVGNTTAAEISSLSQKFMRLGQETDGTTEDFMRINKVMFNTSAIFRTLKQSNDTTRETLEKTAQTLERRFNVTIQDTAKTTDILGRTFGMSATETAKFQESLVATFDAIGLDGKRALSDFASQSNNLAKFNLPDLKQEFVGLSAISEKTGISIDSMMGSLEKFTTFEGALSGAAQLNAAFGTTIDGMELMDTVMTEGPIAGFIKLRETLEASGIQIDKLNYAQMRQLTSTIGMSAEQMRAFGRVSTDTLRNLSSQGLSAAEVQKKITEGRKDAQTTEEKIAENIDNAATNMNNVAKAIEDATRSVSDLIKGFEHFIGAIKIVGGLIGSVLIGGFIRAKAAALATAMATKSMIGPRMASGAFFSGAGATAAGGTGAAGAAGAAGGAGALGTAAAVTGGALIGGYLGHQLNTLFHGRELDASDYGLNRIFDSGQNYIGKEQVASLAPGEIITKRTQKLLEPGTSVTKLPTVGSGTPTNLTINLVGSEGKIFDSSSREISEEKLDKAISHYMSTKVSLLNA